MKLGLRDRAQAVVFAYERPYRHLETSAMLYQNRAATLRRE
jgi:hypothetical protein